MKAAFRRCSSKQVILKIQQYSQKKTLVLESLFKNVSLKFFIKKRLQHKYFPANIAKFLRTAFVINTSGCFQSDPIIGYSE